MNTVAQNARSFECKTCGKSHIFGAYVAAHSKEELIHTCDACGAKHSVRNYRVKLEQPGTLQRRSS